MGDPSVRKVALFRSPKSSSNLCICSSTDYVVSEDNTAYAKMHKNHLARTHKIFNNSIAGEKTFYVNGLRPTSNVIHRSKEDVEANGEAATSESKNALVENLSGNHIGRYNWIKSMAIVTTWYYFRLYSGRRGAFWYRSIVHLRQSSFYRKYSSLGYDYSSY